MGRGPVAGGASHNRACAQGRLTPVCSLRPCLFTGSFTFHGHNQVTSVLCVCVCVCVCACACRLGRVLSFLDVVFLDLARQAGQTPEGVAAAARGEREGAVEGAEGKEGGAEEGAAGADCGILGRSRRRDNGKGSDTDGRHMR